MHFRKPFKPESPKQQIVWDEIELGSGPDPKRLTHKALMKQGNFLALDAARMNPSQRAKNLRLATADVLDCLPRMKENSVRKFSAEFFLYDLSSEKIHSAINQIKRVLIPNGEFSWLQTTPEIQVLEKKLRKAGFDVRARPLNKMELHSLNHGLGGEISAVISEINSWRSPTGHLRSAESQQAYLRAVKEDLLKEALAMRDTELREARAQKIREIKTLDNFINFFWPHIITAIKKG
ncbi:MAG: hypothetical protein V1494_01230 [Candidatus Diapherotrites archaeon]